MRSLQGPTRVDTVLTQVLEKYGVRESVERLEVLQEWSDIVGDPLSEVTRVRGVDNKTLLIEVRSSAWMTELQVLKNDVLNRVNERFEAVVFEKIVFVLAETV
ncbi:MAG: DUF721 domain-containing protein [Gemmatimonadota bacterium]|nr:DUF721 domain-containing protein [Gemmatimonadota bacterium]